MNQEFKNPLQEDTRTAKHPDPCILVIFGATGDLTSRKLLPALYNLANEGGLPAHFVCVGFARRDWSHEYFREKMLEGVREHSRQKPVDKKLWKTFSEGLFYHKSEFGEDEGYKRLDSYLKELDRKFGTRGNRVFYMATQPKFFPGIIEKLSANKLIYDQADGSKWSRVIIEKPFGKDLNSALQLQKDLTQHLNEKQIFRIDHYLGKETVQNLLVFRFSNPIFESDWNCRHIDHVQITVSEDIGIGTRGHFFEEAGILRDIAQNHMMQLLSLVAMEPPRSMTADAIRDEKVKVMESLRPFPKGEMEKSVVRGQYGEGFVGGEPVASYREENDVSKTSNIETFMAMELFIDNWRWSGVPFYLRAGKRLAKRTTEIAIIFKNAPSYLFNNKPKKIEPNTLVISIQPDERISIKMNIKVPGMSQLIHPVTMDFRYSSYFNAKAPEAYERLICDCMSGDATLFARVDEVIASWRQFTPVLEYWNHCKPSDFPNYQSGTWGPEASTRLIQQSGREWRLI